MSRSNEDPTSAAPQHPVLALGNVPLLLPSSASLSSPTAMGQPALLPNTLAASLPLMSPSLAGDRYSPGSLSSSPGALLRPVLSPPLRQASPSSACLSLPCGHLWPLSLTLETHSQLHSCCPSCAVMMLSCCQDPAHACIGRNGRFYCYYYYFFPHSIASRAAGLLEPLSPASQSWAVSGTGFCRCCPPSLPTHQTLH